jgi:hypothetical protein
MKPGQGKGDLFMVRPRDNKARIIGKFPIGIFRPKDILQINTSDHYIGSTSRQG